MRLDFTDWAHGHTLGHLYSRLFALYFPFCQAPPSFQMFQMSATSANALRTTIILRSLRVHTQVHNSSFDQTLSQPLHGGCAVQQTSPDQGELSLEMSVYTLDWLKVQR